MIRRFNVRAKVEYEYRVVDVQSINLYEVEFNDWGEPFTKDELENLLEDEVYAQFDNEAEHTPELSVITSMEYEEIE